MKKNIFYVFSCHAFVLWDIWNCNTNFESYEYGHVITIGNRSFGSIYLFRQYGLWPDFYSTQFWQQKSSNYNKNHVEFTYFSFETISSSQISIEASFYDTTSRYLINKIWPPFVLFWFFNCLIRNKICLSLNNFGLRLLFYNI